MEGGLGFSGAKWVEGFSRKLSVWGHQSSFQAFLGWAGCNLGVISLKETRDLCQAASGFIFNFCMRLDRLN